VSGLYVEQTEEPGARTTLSEKERRMIADAVRASVINWDTNAPGARDYADVYALIVEAVGRTVAALVAAAEERGRAEGVEWLLIYRQQAINGGHGPLAAEPEWITEAADARTSS